MDPEKNQTIFISYRRVDTLAVVRSLSTSLKQAFGPDNVFVDTEAVRTGDRWPKQIENALADATILLVAIGPGWLKIADEYGRRRLDDKIDWVRLEIASALKRGIRVVPLLFQAARLPDRVALPSSIADIVYHQAYEIRDDYWEQDVSALVERLVQFGGKRTTASVRYPSPRAFPEALSSEELANAIRRLDGWNLTTSVIPGREPKMRTELVKDFKFRTFEEALAFMNSAAPYISNANHHPRWENVFSSVLVSLTSWDIGFLPSQLDVELAEHLDNIYQHYLEDK